MNIPHSKHGTSIGAPSSKPDGNMRDEGSTRKNWLFITCRWALVVLILLGIVGSTGILPLLSAPAWLSIPVGVCAVFVGVVEIVDAIRALTKWLLS